MDYDRATIRMLKKLDAEGITPFALFTILLVSACQLGIGDFARAK